VFNLDLDWTIDTYVSRIVAPAAALSVEIPLVKGESVLTSGVKVREQRHGASSGWGRASAQMQMALGPGARQTTLEVSVPARRARAAKSGASS
jgi:hypothetical protein